MPKKILVATPHPAFGELLRISLEENGPYQVRLVQSGKEAQASAMHTSFALAILDADLSEPEMPEVARALQTRLPDIRLLVIPLENEAQQVEVEGVRVDGKITRPYYLPDLLQMVQGLLSPTPVETPKLVDVVEEMPQWPPETASSLPWQRDVELAAGKLKALLPECTADSILIVRLRQLHAFSGKLDVHGAQQINAELGRYWDGSQKSDLVRFLSHESPEQDSLLYATALAEEYVLVLVYDIPIPLTRCRAQSGKLVRLLMTPAAEDVEIVLPAVEIAEPAALIPEPQVPAVAAPKPESPTGDEDESPISDEDEAAMAASLAALLSSMPQPDPMAQPEAVEVVEAESVFHFPWEVEEMKATAAPVAEAANVDESSSASVLPGWITAGGDPVGPFSEPVVEEIWWSTLPQDEPKKIENQSLPVRSPEITSVMPPAVEVPQPNKPRPAWMDVATQPLTEAELPLTPPPQKPRPAWEDVATQPQTEAELPLTLPPQKPRPAWENVATQPLTEAELPLSPPLEKPRAAWEVVDTQPYRIKPAAENIISPTAEPYLGETRQVRTSTTHHKDPSAAVEDSFLAETRPRRTARRSAAQEPVTVHLGPPEAAIRISQALPQGYTCTCVLIPHVAEHYLVGGMADLLKQSLVKVAGQNRWKVSQVLVRPQYLQWTTETGEEILPDKVAELMRRRLSTVIFKQYPALKKQNKSGNFWSDELLALQGSEPIPPQRLRTFTRQARARAEMPADEPKK